MSKPLKIDEEIVAEEFYHDIYQFFLKHKNKFFKEKDYKVFIK